MYRGSHPTTGDDPSPLPTTSAMLANMNRLPTMPSRPTAPHRFSSYDTYRSTNIGTSRPEIVPPSQHRRPQGADGTLIHAQQLPSLRTLLEPEILESKPHDTSSRSSDAPHAHSTPGRYESASPTLKRRHEFDSFSHGDINHTIPSRTAPVHRSAPFSPANDPQSTAYPASLATHGSQPLEYARHGFSSRSSQNEGFGQSYRPASSVSAMSVSSDPLGAHASHAAPEDFGDSARPARRRTESAARAPVKTTRYVGQREIPGQGVCFVYEDGTYCRAIIDGEPVNPSWGITKAGKPRKRLAQACLTCREKKIKCEPGYPKCHQCTKSQRDCRGGLNQQSMSSNSEDLSPSSSITPYKNQPVELAQPMTGLDKPKDLDDHFESSKIVESCQNYPLSLKNRSFRPASGTNSLRDMSVHSMDSDWSGSPNNQDPEDTRRGLHQDYVASLWEQDPYDTDARMTMHLVDLYFSHAGRATYGMFPRQPFVAWIETSHRKSQDQLMLLYSVLALGSVFSPDSEALTVGKRFAAVAAFAIEKRFGKFSLQLCQSRLLLGLYNFARGKSQEAWDFCGAGLRAISALQLNTEDGILELSNMSADLDYGFDRLTFEECCRRTFWSGFLMDRYNGFCGGTLCVISTEDTFVRLPCLESSFESGIACDTPLYDAQLLDRRPAADPPPLGRMAYLVLISIIWGDIVTFSGRATHRPDVGYERHYEAFYSRINERLDAWYTMLPVNLQYSQQNLDQSIVDGFSGTFVSLHALYHASIIRINRHARVRALAPDKIIRNIKASFRSASHYMSMMHSLSEPSRQQRLPANAATDYLFSTPFPGYTLLLCVDVASAVGSIATIRNLIDSLSGTLACIQELAPFWASARAQYRTISQRIKQLEGLAAQDEQGTQNGNLGSFWRLPTSLEGAFGSNDTIYRASEQILFGIVDELTSR